VGLHAEDRRRPLHDVASIQALLRGRGQSYIRRLIPNDNNACITARRTTAPPPGVKTPPLDSPTSPSNPRVAVPRRPGVAVLLRHN